MRALLRHPAFRGPDDELRLLHELTEAIERVHRENRAEFTLAAWLAEKLDPATPAAVAEAERALWRRVARLEPMPGVREGLATLAGDGVRLGAVSNAVFGSATLSAELERHGLLSPFRFVLSSADLGVRKPDPAIFREALARIGGAAAETWFVGDSFANDVVGAHATGLTAIWLAASGEPAADVPHHRARDWTELLALYASRRD